jgi:hypothetical protein
MSHYGPPGGSDPGQPPAGVEPTRTERLFPAPAPRRRTRLIALLAALVCGGGGTVAYLLAAAGDTTRTSQPSATPTTGDRVTVPGARVPGQTATPVPGVPDGRSLRDGWPVPTQRGRRRQAQAVARLVRPEHASTV